MYYTFWYCVLKCPIANLHSKPRLSKPRFFYSYFCQGMIPEKLPSVRKYNCCNILPLSSLDINHCLSTFFLFNLLVAFFLYC